ncbi:MAG: hypothetical protein ACXWZW_01320 [Solirubrobacterales bacterium]
MSLRAATAAAVCLLAAGAALPPGPGGEGGAVSPAPARAADCVPVQHSKTVVKRKKVRRNGKIVRVKRKRVVRWTTCAPPPPSPPTCAEPSSILGITARDQAGSTFTLSRPCVSAGVVSVELNNLGEDPHNVFLSPNGPGSEPIHRLPGAEPFEVPSLGRDSDEFALTPGDWYLWCDLLTHEQQGMSATLAVR